MYLSVKSFERSSTLAVAKEAIFFINNRIWRMIVGKPHVYVIFTPAVNYFCWVFFILITTGVVLNLARTK